MTQAQLEELHHGLNWILKECDEIARVLEGEPEEVRNIRLAVSGISTLLICERMKNDIA